MVESLSRVLQNGTLIGAEAAAPAARLGQKPLRSAKMQKAARTIKNIFKNFSNIVVLVSAGTAILLCK